MTVTTDTRQHTTEEPVQTGPAGRAKRFIAGLAAAAMVTGTLLIVNLSGADDGGVPPPATVAEGTRIYVPSVEAFELDTDEAQQAWLDHQNGSATAVVEQRSDGDGAGNSASLVEDAFSEDDLSRIVRSPSGP